MKLQYQKGYRSYTTISSGIMYFFVVLLCFIIFNSCNSVKEKVVKTEKSKVLRDGNPEELQKEEGLISKIADRIEEKINNGQVTAAQVLVAWKGEILLKRAFGRISKKNGAPPVQLHNPFLVASITKPVTATAVMILVEEGKIKLSDPVKQYIPEFTGGERDRIVVRNLLNHTSGLPDMLPENEELRKRNTPLRDFIPVICTTPLLFTPGTKVQYQSMGIALLGEIVERVTDIPLRDFMKQEIFDPLGMKNTFLGTDRSNMESLVQCDVPEEEGAEGSNRWDWNSAYWRDFGAPWGGLHSTVGDLAILFPNNA